LRVVTQPWTQAARCQSITRAIHACCSGSSRRAYGDQPRLRSAIDTSAASALSGTVKPALRRPFGVSTNTRRRRCGIRLTIANGRVNGCERPPARDKPSDGMGAGAGRARATVQHVGRPDYFPRVAWTAKEKVHQIYARLSPPYMRMTDVNVRYWRNSGHWDRGRQAKCSQADIVNRTIAPMLSASRRKNA